MATGPAVDFYCVEAQHYIYAYYTYYCKSLIMQHERLEPATTYPAVVGGVLTQIRNQKSLRQEDLARAVGVTQTTWSRIETGQSNITVEHLRLAAGRLESEPNQILYYADKAVTELRTRGAKVMGVHDDGNLKTAVAIIAAVTLAAIITSILLESRRA
jgi:transcriptional regulator with XRE-family HTH domain